MVNINKNFVYEKGKKSLISRICFYCIPSAKKRTEYLKKHDILAGIGQHVHWQPRFFPTDPYCLLLHNNIAVATNVTFLGHDIINYVYNGMQNEKVYGFKGCIEIFDNVFIGANSTICPNVKIGPNAIIAAGSVVAKNVEQGTVVGGNPAKIIGSFDDLMERRLQLNLDIRNMEKEERIEKAWKDFWSNNK